MGFIQDKSKEVLFYVAGIWPKRWLGWVVLEELTGEGLEKMKRQGIWVASSSGIQEGFYFFLSHKG